MEDLKLDLDEGIILQTTDVERYKKNDEYIEVYELYLTNKNLICIYEKSNGMFKKTENVIERIPLTDIKVVNGKVQIFKRDDNDYGLGLQILFTNGSREHFVFCNNKKELQTWMDSIIETITGEKPTITENKKNVDKVSITTGGLMAGFKKVVDTAKEMVDDIKTQVIDENNSNIEEIDEDDEEEIAEEIVEEVVEQEEKKEEKKKKQSSSEKYKYCSKCGEKLSSNSKFCNICGNPTDIENEKAEEKEIKIEEQTERKIVYDGKIHKCPNCGEVLKSFSMNCPACGYELRNANASSAIREFTLKLEKIESNREYEKHRGLFSMAEKMQTISKTDEQKISLIKSFAIPNSKEDMLEFMILATSSMNMRVYDSANTTPVSKSEKAVNEAWYAKVQQVYEKARRSYSNDNIFCEIKELYEKCQRDIEKAKKKSILKWVLMVGWIPLLWIVIIVGLLISSPKDEEKEIKRLENIVVEVQEALDKEEYKHALRIADTIDYQRYDKEEERKWDLEREYWVEKVIEEAKENGITLEYTYTEDVDNANDKSSDDSSSGGFVEGFKEGLHSNDEEIQENIDQFKENLNGGNSNNKDENETSNSSNTSASFGDNIVATSNKYIKIKEVGYTMVGDYLTCIVSITNTDSKKAIEFPSFRVTAYDENGKVLGSEERVLNILYPNQSMIDQGTLIEVSEKPHKVEVTIIEPDEDDIVSVSSLEHPEYKEMKCQNLSVNSDKITGEVYNPNNYKIESAMITVIFRDSNNKIVSSESAFVDDIPANGKIPFDISLASDAKTTDKIEAFAYLW